MSKTASEAHTLVSDGAKAVSVCSNLPDTWIYKRKDSREESGGWSIFCHSNDQAGYRGTGRSDQAKKRRDTS